MLDIIKSYINDEDYYLIIMNNRIIIKNYNKLFEFNDDYILIEINNIVYKIIGNNFKIIKSTKTDLEINGSVDSIEKI